MEKTFWWFFLRIMIGVAFMCLVVAFLYIRRLLRENKTLRFDLESWQIDPLTGLLSRRMFMELYRRMFSVVFTRLFRADGLRRKSDGCQEETTVQRDERKRTELTVVFVDIDHFKRVNDVYGHEAGDKVLKAVGELLLSHVRASDLCGRIGGEEMACVLNTDIFGAQAFIRRFRRSLRVMIVDVGGKGVQVTVSMGAVQLLSKQETMDSLLKDADAAMYQAKAAGRDAYTLREEFEFKVHKD